MLISKNTIRLSLTSGNILATLVNLLNISKKHDDNYTYKKVLLSFNTYAECVESIKIKGKNTNFQEEINLISRITVEVKDLLDQHIKDDWTVSDDDPQNFKETDDIFSQYPNLFKNPEDNDTSVTILFLAANPKDTNHLRLSVELSKIDNAIQISEFRDKINLETRWALKKSDLRRAMLKYNPTIVHFSGHGSSKGEILLEDKDGYSDLIDPVALGSFFEDFNDKLKCVVLNACYSEIQAKEIQKYIPYVIGMKEEIPDESAIEFSEAFYDAIGAMKKVPKAFQIGIKAIGLTDGEDAKIPVLVK